MDDGSPADPRRRNAAAFDLPRIERRRVYEEIVERIEALIADGQLRPGDHLPSERELMQRLGVGRTSVREALFALQRKGLIAPQMGERATVREPSADVLGQELSGAVRYYMSTDRGMGEFQSARALFESALARHAARRATPEDVKALAEVLAANRRALDDVEAFIETDVAFHYKLAEIAGNPLFTAMHRALLGWLRQQRALSIGPEGAREAAVRAHTRIHEAVAAGDPDAAEQAMLDHLEEVARFFWQARGCPDKTPEVGGWPTTRPRQTRRPAGS